MYLICSGNKSYYFEEKSYLSGELTRISELLNEMIYKKEKWKKKFKDNETIYNTTIDQYEQKLEYWRNKCLTDKIEVDTQTDINKTLFNKIIKNHESVLYYKNLNHNMLSDSIEKIKHKCSNAKYIPKHELLKYIYDIYCEKISIDTKNSGLGPNQQPIFNDIIYNHLLATFKFIKDTKNHCEELILSTIKYRSKTNNKIR